MSSNDNLKNMVKYSLAIGCACLGVSLNVQAQTDPCPPRYRARLDALKWVAPPGWEERMRALPPQHSEGAGDAELVFISNDLSVIRNSPEFQRFKDTYRIDPLNIDPKVEPKRLLANAEAMYGHFVSEAEQACNAIGGFNQRILELQEDSNKAFEDYRHDQWIDFASNSLSVSGTVILYATGVGEVVQAGKAALAMRKLERLERGALLDKAEGKKTIQSLHEFWGVTLNPAGIKFLGREVFLQEARQQVINAQISLYKIWNSMAQSTQAMRASLEKAKEISIAVATRANVSMGQTLVNGVASNKELITEFVIGGNVWKQFEGFVNPYEEMINLNLEQKKKWAGIYQKHYGQAQALKGKIEALMTKIVTMEAQPAPPGVGYGGFSISRQEG